MFDATQFLLYVYIILFVLYFYNLYCMMNIQSSLQSWSAKNYTNGLKNFINAKNTVPSLNKSSDILKKLLKIKC